MTDVRDFLALFARAATLQVCDLAMRLLLLKLLTTRLTPRDYGSYAFWTAAAAMGTIVFGAELYRYLQRHARDVPDTRAWLRSQLLGETAFILLVMCAAALLQATPLSKELGIPAGSMLLLLGALAWSELMVVELVRFSVLLERGALGEGAKLLRSCITVVLVVSLPGLTVSGALTAVLAANVGAAYMLWRILSRRADGSSSWSVAQGHLATMIPHAAFFVVPALANQLMKVGDRFFVYGALSAEELARYSVAYNLQLLCFGATGGLASALVYPLVLRDSKLDTRRRSRRWLVLQVVIQSVASLVLLALSGPLVAFISSPAYGDAVPLVRALTPLPVLMVLSGAMLMHFLAAGERRPYAVATVAGAALAVTLYAVLVPRLGVDGAVIGTLAGYAGTALLAWFLGRRGALPSPAVSAS